MTAFKEAFSKILANLQTGKELRRAALLLVQQNANSKIPEIQKQAFRTALKKR